MAGTPDTLRYAQDREQTPSQGNAPARSNPLARENFREADLRSELDDVSQHLHSASETQGDIREISTLGRYSYLSLGGLCVAFGTIGIFVPGLPTTIFMIIALWSFTRSSPKMRDWLYNHRHFGPALQNWVNHRSIPTRARQIALASLLISALVISQTVSGLACLAFILFICTPVASFLWTLPANPKN